MALPLQTPSQPLLLQSNQLFARPKDGEDSYQFQGRAFVRVTSVLGTAASEHLYGWHGTEAAKEAALHLVHAGMHGDEVIMALAESRPPQTISMDEAYRRIMNWQDNAKAAYRYRDLKGRIGSLLHHYAYHRTLTGKPSSLLTWLKSKAMEPNTFPPEVIERFKELGKDVEALATDLAFRTVPYAESYEAWLDAFQPEFEGVGLEAFIANDEEEYAGTCDAWATFKKSIWEKHGPWEWPNDTALLVCDYKTSKTLSQDVICQLAAYAHATAIVHEPSNTLLDLPEHDGAAALHIQDSGGMAKVRAWSNKTDILAAYEFGFLPLLERWRWTQNRPQPVKSRRARKASAPKPNRGEKKVCPF